MTKPKHRIFSMSFASVYPLYVAKAEKKGRTKDEVDEIVRWLTGYTKKQLEKQIQKKTDFEAFLGAAPKLNPARKLITGVVCGIRVEDIKEPTMQEIRYIDKLIDELAKGKAMEKILRSPASEFPASMGAVAQRSLMASGITTLKQVAARTEKELLAIHGVGPKAVRILKEELVKKKLRLKK